jgi:hypothetical protein
MSATPRLAMPLLSPGQAQKELFHNEALQTLDTFAAAAVEEPARADPPTAPVPGACYIVADGATGAWAGHDGALAAYSSGGWRLEAPVEGLAVYVRSASLWCVFRGGAWESGTLRGSTLGLGGQQVVGPRGAAITSPGGGSTVDAEARAVVGQILAALRQHGLINP